MNLFLYDKLLTEYQKYNIPLTFISFGKMEDTCLYWNRKKYVAVSNTFQRKHRMGDVVYGGIFHLDDELFYIRLIDAYYSCSKSRVFENNKYDLLWRFVRNVYPIQFNSLEDFKSYKFKTLEPMQCTVYLGNQFDTKLFKTVHAGRKKCAFGLDVQSFTNLYERVKGEI